MTVNSVTAALFTWHALKLMWQQRISDHQQVLYFPRIERRSHSTRQKLFSFHITNEIFGLSAVKTTPSLARLVRDILGSDTAHFCTFSHRFFAYMHISKREIFHSYQKSRNFFTLFTFLDQFSCIKSYKMWVYSVKWPPRARIAWQV